MDLKNLTNAESGYKVKYYEDEACQKVRTEVVGANSVKDAATIVEHMAFSEFHVISVEEIGLLNLREKDLGESETKQPTV